jgi:hypothetical protein
MYQINDIWTKELTIPNTQLIPVRMKSFKKRKVLFVSEELFMFWFLLFVGLKFLALETNGLLLLLLSVDCG